MRKTRHTEWKQPFRCEVSHTQIGVFVHSWPLSATKAVFILLLLLLLLTWATESIVRPEKEKNRSCRWRFSFPGLFRGSSVLSNFSPTSADRSREHVITDVEASTGALLGLSGERGLNLDVGVISPLVCLSPCLSGLNCVLCWLFTTCRSLMFVKRVWSWKMYSDSVCKSSNSMWAQVKVLHSNLTKVQR